jgi:3-oxoacyl-[acyl-carrier protein] reductase
VNYVRDKAAANEVVAQARKFGVEAIAVRADVADVHQASDLIMATIKRFGHVDVLVANAGIWEGAAVEEMSEEMWDRILDINLKGTWAVCRAVVPDMKRREGGAIVIVSSTSGQRGEAGYSSYSASKGGQISFTKSLASELAPNIRVNGVAPGWVDTGMNDDVFEEKEFMDGIVSDIPLRRLATADDVAVSIVFLASAWAQHITGEILNVNGGAVLCG